MSVDIKIRFEAAVAAANHILLHVATQAMVENRILAGGAGLSAKGVGSRLLPRVDSARFSEVVNAARRFFDYLSFRHKDRDLVETKGLVATVSAKEESSGWLRNLRERVFNTEVDAAAYGGKEVGQ